MINSIMLENLERLLSHSSPHDWIAQPITFKGGKSGADDEWLIMNNHGHIVASNVVSDDALFLVAIKNMLPALIHCARHGLSIKTDSNIPVVNADGGDCD